MPYVESGDWCPSPGVKLEGKALEMVKSNSSLSVLAGPGAGKTELLAQRAMYLLTTGVCPAPKKILAISFKVDAARNLQKRVEERCPPELSGRFESLTFHALAKRLIDQFREALPSELQPSSDYSLIFPDRNIWEDFRRAYNTAYPFIHNFNNTQLDKIVHQQVPVVTLENATTNDQIICRLWWTHHLSSSKSKLTFGMIILLAVYILRQEALIKAVVQETFTHVFLDEFQDVTDQQYDLIKAAFLDSNAIITAVGDSNQAIMQWAGAKADIFQRFERDFYAGGNRLLFNFRSNGAIVDLINSLAATFDSDYVKVEAARKEEPIPENAIEAWVFATREMEGQYLASFIKDNLVLHADLKPSDFVILARIKVDDVEKRISGAFEKAGLKIRNEARNVGEIAIQDLVKERIYDFLVAALKLAVNVRTGSPFQACRDIIADVGGIDVSSDHGHRDSLERVRVLINDIIIFLDERRPSEVSSSEIIDMILKIISPAEFKRAYREYASGDRLQVAIAGFKIFLSECTLGAESWEECIVNMEGKDSVRLMTIHKCKGLEYHSVIFVECNDDAFWGKADDVNVFFVALSRARERIRFSFAKDSQGFENVRDFANKLKRAGVEFRTIEFIQGVLV